MAWGRVLVALVLTALVLGTTAMTFAQVAGTWRVELPSAPGLSAADATALSDPYLDLVAGREDALLGRLADGVDREAARVELRRLRQLLPQTQESSNRLLRWGATYAGSQRLYGIYEHVYPDHVVRVETELVRGTQAEPWRILNFHVTVAPKSQLSANAFTLNGKPAGFVAFVIAAALVPIFCWATALFALFWKDLKRRWLWLLFILVGVSTFSMNGATGLISFSPISFQLLGGSAFWSGSAFEPWVFGVSIPIGALAFWLTRLGIKQTAPASTETNVEG